MPTHAGHAPWYKPVKEKTLTGRQRTTLTSGNMQWDYDTGWHYKRGRGWKSKGVKSGTVKKEKRIAPDGKTVTVYTTSGYDDYVGFHSHDNPDEEAMNFALNAFDKEDKSHGPIFEVEGCGHIAKIEYAQMQQVLRVTFANNGAICIFFRVPSAVAGELIALAKSKATRISAVDGKQRHVLGMTFWDIIRIRGQKHGSRYPFEYEKHGDYKLTGSNRRYSVVLSDENIKSVLGNRFYGRELKPGEKVTALLSEEEYAKWQKEEHKKSIMAVKMQTVTDKDKGDIEKEVTGVDQDYYNSSAEEGGPGLQEILGAKDYARYTELQHRMSKALSKAQADREAELSGQHLNLSESAKKAIWAKAYSLAKTTPELQGKHGKPSLRKIEEYVLSEVDKMSTGTNEDYADKRFKSYHVKASLNPARVTVTPSQVFSSDKTALNDYLRLTSVIRRFDNKTEYASAYVGRGWTVGELEDFANPEVPGSISLEHSLIYKRLLDQHEYEAALNFLKNHKHTLYSNGKVIARRAYASQYDFIVQNGGKE